MSPAWGLLLVIIVCGADNEQLQGPKSRSDEFMPRIVEHPSDLVVRRDQPGTMNCRAEGNPPATIEWYRNGEYVDVSKAHGALILGGSLFFYHIKGKSDEGVYTCLARNRLGTALSRNASLTIAVLKEEFRQEPSDKVVATGKQLLIECSPPKGHPDPVVTWKKDGVLLDRNSSHYTFAAGKLTIARALRTDSGVYICVAANQAGEKTSRAAQISVLEPPQFTSKPGDVVTKSGSTVQFLCGAQGVPRPVVQWSKEQGALPTGRYAITNENTLSLQRVTTQDSGRYLCTARNQVDAVTASAQLVVEDPLDTGQRDRQKEITAELSNVRVYLDVVAVQNSSSVRVQWRVSPVSQYTEGYAVFYRPHTPANSDWVKWHVAPVSVNSIVIPALRRGRRYEFKIRPYGRTVYGADSNIKHIQVPEEVPGYAPRDVNVTMAGSGNGTLIVSWEPPTQNADIKAYKVWCFGNETLYEANWTVDGATRSLEIPMLPAGIKYQVQVAAIYDAGMGRPSNPKYVFIEPSDVRKETREDKIPLDLILQVIKHPAFIASVGAAIWIILMVTVVYLCRRHSKHYSTKKHSGLYRFASEDTIIKHRMDTSDSPWLSNTWKSASCSRDYSSTTSMNSQLLWMENKDTADFHKSTVSFERKSDSSLSRIIPLVPDSSSMYRALYVDLPGKDLTTFQRPVSARPPGMGLNARCPVPLGLYDHRPFPLCLNHGSANSLAQGGTRNKITQKPVVPVPPNVALKEPWSQNCKRELHHVNSAPLSPYRQTAEQSDRAPSEKSSAGNQAGKGEYAKVMKTFSSPKILHYTTSLKVMDFLPYSPSLPPPPVPPPKEKLSSDRQDKVVSDSPAYSDPREGVVHKQTVFSKRKPPPSTLVFNHAASRSASMSVSDDNVLTPDDVAQYLELSDRGDNTRHPSESDATLPRPFTSSSSYGYICSPLPSDLGEVDAADEDDDDDLELGEVSSLKSYRKYCETPTSSISEYESSMAGSLINGWGSVSEDNYTSARCSMVSSSDGSFLMDANFAKALAVAVDSFCLGMSQSEAAGGDRLYTDFSPSASPLDGLLAGQNQGESADLNHRKPKVTPLPVLDWNIDWMDELEAKYSQRNQRACIP
ncbi:roundabout homolog 4 isoform X2 [Pseudophryne corroboree]|uniref:roundabout homolog 4 isoform X2 n=1 Tax=Pseudophryne corroboree TaxID=495146 RepID=UPI003081901F